jgi:hypothetical protein
MVLVPAAKQLAGVLLMVGTAGVVGCAFTVKLIALEVHPVVVLVVVTE